MNLYQIVILVEAEEVSEDTIKQMQNYDTECAELVAKLLNKPVEETNFVLASVGISREVQDAEEIDTAPDSN